MGQLAEDVLFLQGLNERALVFVRREIAALRLHAHLQGVEHFMRYGLGAHGAPEGRLVFVGGAPGLALIGIHAGALGDGFAHGLAQFAVDGSLTFEAFDLPAEIDHIGLHAVVGRGVLGGEHPVVAAPAVEERFGGVPRLGALFAQFKNLVHGKFLLFRRPRIAGL